MPSKMVDLAMEAQTSGGLLVAVSASDADEAVSRIRDGGDIETCVVGQVATLERDSYLALRT